MIHTKIDTRSISILGVCMLVLSLFLHDSANAEGVPDSNSVSAVDKDTISYRTEFTDLKDKNLTSIFKATSQLIALNDHPPPTLVALERRVRTDLDTFQKVLRSEGYYDGKLTYRIEAKQRPVQVFIDVDTGPRYHTKQYLIEYVGPGSDTGGLPRESVDVGLSLGNPARTQLIVDAQKRLLQTLAGIGHPLAIIIDQKVVVDHGDNSMSVKIQIEPGETARFGSLIVEETTDIDTDYIKSFVPWNKGDIFDRRKVNKLRDLLLGTGLFATVAIERPNQLNQEGMLPVTIRVSKRKHRSIGLAGRWSTDEGFAVEAFWEHRNLLGRQERLTLATEIGEIKQEFDASFVKPNFLHQHQNLLVNGALAHEDTPAYKGPLTRYFGGLERPINKEWRILAGFPVEFSNLSDLQGTRDFFLFGLDIQGNRDTSNDRLDPSEGTRIRLSLRPYSGKGEGAGDTIFLISEMSGTGYYAPDEGRRFIFAGRAKLGSIVGEETSTLPANKRFYAGGGASIRGYEFQSVGPLDPDKTPLGGRSLFEIGTELRIKLTDTIGGVIFLEGGNVYDDEFPDISSDLQWAAGVGVRYFTAVGPMRLDFGFPLNSRKGIDDSMQFYISIGQAF
ncbi:MAG: outer membrane protein assembly factor [Planctomycetes bacterium]|nr:outer membrane protein assembly factor [Planctomycetota bacterium]